MSDPTHLQRPFLGTGWAFPVRLDRTGEVGLVSEEEDIRQAIVLILQTAPGERPMNPDFGSGLRSLLFEPITRSTIALVEHYVERALVTWEPRIDSITVTVTAADRALGRLDIDVRYRVRDTNTFYNLVHPYYLQEGAA